MNRLLARAALLAALAVPMAASAQVTSPLPPIPPEGTLLEVTAEGKTTRVPDLATIRAGVVTQAPNAGEAFSGNARQMASVIAAVRAAGVAPRDVQTASVSLQPQYRYGENQPPILTGYQATNSVTVRLRDMDRAGAVVDALVKAGANQVEGPNLMLDQPEAALDEARADAVKRARARAELYARAAGLSVRRIISISEAGAMAGPMPPVMFARAEAAQADTKILPGEQAVTAQVSVRFLLQ
jgi:uncharacterized protein YggE